MRDLVSLLPVRNLRTQPLRSLLTVIGAACGVALFVAIEIINASTLRYFGDGVRAMAGGASLAVSASQAGFPQAERQRLAALPGVRAAVPSIEAIVYTVPRHESEPSFVPVLGIDAKLEPFARLHRLEGDARPAQLDVLRDSNAILLPSAYAPEAPPSQRQSVNVIAQSGIERLPVAGRLAPGTGGTAGLALMDLATAQRLFGFEGRITRVDVVVDDGVDVDAVASAARAALGPSFRVESSRAREADMQRLVRGYQVLLRFLSVIALLAGAAAVGATITLSVSEHAKSIAVLRALGGSRSHVLALVLAEAALLGALALALGMSAGWIGAKLLIGAVSRSLANTYMVPIEPSALVYPPAVAASHAIFAWIMVISTALGAAVAAIRIPPAAGMGRSEIRTASGFPAWLRALGYAGTACAAYLAIVTGAGLDRQDQQWQSANAIVAAAAALAVAPAAALASVRLAQRTALGRNVVDRFVLLRLAAANVLRTPGRSAWRSLLLSIGLVIFVAASELHDSLLASVEGWFDRTVYSDLLVSSPGKLFLMQVQPLNESLARDIDAIPGVRVEAGMGAMAIRYATVRYGNSDIMLKAFDRPHPWLERLPFDFRSEYRVERGGDIFAGDRRTTLVSENFAKHFGKGPGDTLTLDSPTGPLRLEILGVVTDFASPTGVIYLPRDLYRARWGDHLVSVFSVMVQPGADPAAVADALEAKLASKAVHVTNGRELRKQTREILNESFAYSRAIEGAVLIAAVLAIMNSMTAAVLAKQREISVLRALGMSREATVGMVILEGLCLGIPAALVATVLGSLLGYLCLAGILSALMGWTLEFHASARMLGTTLLLGAISGTTASAVAAWKAASVDVTEGLAAY